MGQRVEFSSNGHTSQGYVAAPDAEGAAVVVIQEWWGLVPHIESVADRFATEGFLALAPDLYHGKKATSPDEAGRLLMEVDVDRAEREISGAGAHLLKRSECSSKAFGVVGFCMGGALAQYTATMNHQVGAAVSFYGGFRKVNPRWESLQAPILLIYGENDKGLPPEHARELAEKLRSLGKTVELKIYPDAGHAFFNETLPSYKKDAAVDAWTRTVQFFKQHLH